MPGYLIGLDYGTESARGILLDSCSGAIEGSHTHVYRHGVMNRVLPDGTRLPPAWALQVASDYTEAAAEILAALGRGKQIDGIGLGFTASTPLPARADGTPLSTLYPSEPHAYVKLWKHQSAQPWADRINARGGEFLRNFGGKVSGEWLLAKAAQLAEEAPALWNAADRFIEAGDWLVWQLTGQENRSLGSPRTKRSISRGSDIREMLCPVSSRSCPNPNRLVQRPDPSLPNGASALESEGRGSLRSRSLTLMSLCLLLARSRLEHSWERSVPQRSSSCSITGSGRYRPASKVWLVTACSPASGATRLDRLALAIPWPGSSERFLEPSESTKTLLRTTRPPPAYVPARTISWRSIGGTATAFPMVTPP